MMAHGIRRRVLRRRQREEAARAAERAVYRQVGLVGGGVGRGEMWRRWICGWMVTVLCLVFICLTHSVPPPAHAGGGRRRQQQQQ